MKILITGSSGFIGGNLVPMLQLLGCETIGVDVRPGKNTDYVIKKLIDIPQMFSENDFDFLINLAAETDTVNSVDYLSLNYEEVLNLRKEWSEIYFVQASSMLANLEYFKRMDFNTFKYAVSKRLVEERFAFDERFLSMRFPMVYGLNGMSNYHTKKFRFFATVFRFFKVKQVSYKKSMLNVELLGARILAFYDARASGVHYVCDPELKSIEELAFYLTGQGPNQFRIVIPDFIIRVISALIPKIKRLVDNSQLRYDFR